MATFAPMIYIIASILAATSIGIIFKLFSEFKIDVVTAVVFNYFAAILTGWVISGSFPIQSNIVDSPTFSYALVLGMIFIFSFTAIGKCVDIFGVTITAIIQRMSLLITVSFAIFYYDESLTLSKILGIVCAFLSIIFVNYKPAKVDQSKVQKPAYYWLLLLFVFLSAGIIEIVLQFVEQRVAGSSADPAFISMIFVVSFSIGLIGLLIGFISGKMKWSTKSMLAGFVLGIPNFLSVYYIMKSLGAGFEGSFFFPVNNVATITITTLIAYFFFKEKLSNINIFGVVLALAAISLISLVNF